MLLAFILVRAIERAPDADDTGRYPMQPFLRECQRVFLEQFGSSVEPELLRLVAVALTLNPNPNPKPNHVTLGTLCEIHLRQCFDGGICSRDA